ncbi:MAG: hypothetical protein OEL78_03835 [Hyphomicrobiales bacterium]|nr:hypothetical protein [Hyphomicrobiales bacterium]
MRIFWIMVGLCAATLAVAQMVRPPPNTPPVLPHSFDGDLVPARPLSDLPPSVQDSVAQALAADDCAAATSAVTGVYLREYPRFRWILDNRDTLMLWWYKTGRGTYPEIYACDVIDEFVAASAAYAAGGGDFRWCGQSLLAEPRPDKEAAPMLYRLVRAIDTLLPMTLQVRQDVPFSVDALRAVLASDEEYHFVVLPEAVRYNILLILDHTSQLSPGERAEFNALAGGITDWDRQMMMDFIDSGYEFATVQSIDDCIASAR